MNLPGLHRRMHNWTAKPAFTRALCMKTHSKAFGLVVCADYFYLIVRRASSHVFIMKARALIVCRRILCWQFTKTARAIYGSEPTVVASAYLIANVKVSPPMTAIK